MKNENILISGAGVVGPTLAFWLSRWGFRPTIVERAPALRTGGYLLDFSGAGYDVAQRMDLVPALRRRSVRADATVLVDRHGKTVHHIDMHRTLATSADRYLVIGRSALAGTIYTALDDRVETVFGDRISRIHQGEHQVEVDFEHGGRRRFDLVIGCDGLHSQTRALAFGEEHRFVRPMGFAVAAFTVPEAFASEPGTVTGHLEAGRQAWSYGYDDGSTAFSLYFAQTRAAEIAAGAVPNVEAFRRAFAGAGWQVPAILERLSGSDEVFLDLVSQTRMPQWSRGRVALAGDASACPSLISGQGSAFGMATAYVLAGELAAAGGDHTIAFPAYQARLKPFISAQQAKVRRSARLVIPKGRAGRVVQDAATRLLSVPLIAKRATGRIADVRMALPDYAPPVAT
jgi:2-polyprenyl-6-methoxyphenol hydroxylase-like FAD-dependent oxidoreductase